MIGEGILYVKLIHQFCPSLLDRENVFPIYSRTRHGITRSGIRIPSGKAISALLKDL